MARVLPHLLRSRRSNSPRCAILGKFLSMFRSLRCPRDRRRVSGSFFLDPDRQRFRYMSIRGNLTTGLAAFHSPPSFDESSRAGRLCCLVEQTDDFQCKGDIVLAFFFTRTISATFPSVFFFSFTRRRRDFLGRCSIKRTASQEGSGRTLSRASVPPGRSLFTCFYVGAFFRAPHVSSTSA